MVRLLAIGIVAALAIGASGHGQENEPGAVRERKAVRVIEAKEARDLVSATRRVLRKKGARLNERIAAVEPLTQCAHERLVPMLLEVATREASVSLRKMAATGLGVQPPNKARPALLEALGRDNRPVVTAALVQSLGRGSFQVKRDWDMLAKLFEREYGEPYVVVQRAILDLVRSHEVKRSWRLLVEHLDEPYPEDIHGAANPPANYWEGRWKSWRAWREDVKAALFTITGQRFSGAEEARAWIKKHGKKRGLK